MKIIYEKEKTSINIDQIRQERITYWSILFGFCYFLSSHTTHLSKTELRENDKYKM